ncbi:DMT family transporter [Amycolatopsis sp. NPDC052450]|uniref:DMT family transporter n=1 Tax=Amycolatopsis sp. NPDC052450 TaxID=3363937 RepID=UPI0037C786BA
MSFARPASGDNQLTDDELAIAGSALAAILVCCLTAAGRSSGTSRALGLATATGVLFGVTAGLAKLAVGDLRDGIDGALAHWAFYAAAATGVSGFVLSQYTFRASSVLAPALAVMVALDPVIGIAIGTLWLDERIETTPIAIAGQVIALSTALTGIAILSRQWPSPLPPERRHR